MNRHVHACHALRCTTPVPPKTLMCGRHWRMLPRSMRAAIWVNYRPGQEIDKQPSRTYLEAAWAAVDWIFEHEPGAAA
ncbi:hypothetical protein A5646_03295 [Mycobacterium sp. 1245499.0]|nr:hypothetical protein A5646_03295 [Mycobacterium sp. 1245499.0]